MKRILLTQGQFAIIDNKNYEWLSQWKWCVKWHEDIQNFHVVRNNRCESGKHYLIYMAREILGLKRGDKRQSDHVNHKTLDNCESNLRIVTCQQNHFNRRNVKGYIWDKRRRKYIAMIKLNGKNIYLGGFSNTKEAHNAYIRAKKLYHKI